MVRCTQDSNECIPCCDFCVYVKHDSWLEKGKLVTGGPIGCNLHPDREHQDIAEGCGYCQDFKCFRADKEKGFWFEGWDGLH